MKNEILDDIPFDGIYGQLKNREKALWEGKPFYKIQLYAFRNDKSGDAVLGSITAMLVVLFLLIVFISIFINANWGEKIFLGILFLAAIAKPIYQIFARKKIKYLISDERIIFQLFSNFKQEYHSIPLEEIKDIVVTQEDENYGTIFLAIKNPQSVRFDTYNLTSGDRRHQPTLEMIENVEEVADYIRKAIRKKM